MSTAKTYKAWTSSRSNEDLDRTQQLADQLTDEDRKAGRPAPKHGCGDANYSKAKDIVNRANRYSRGFAGDVEYTH